MSVRRSSGTRKIADALRVLIVDDDPDCSELLAIILEREGHETRVAGDGFQALPLAAEFRPQLAFLDVGLPGMDGVELARALRSNAELLSCHLVAVTGYDAPVDPGCVSPFDGYLTKPVDLNQVFRVVLECSAREREQKPALG